MRQIKLLNGLLWAVNGLLGAGIVVFAFLFLLFPDPVDYRLPTEDTGTGRIKTQAAPTDYSYLRNLGNPVLPKMAGPEVRGPNDLERVAKLVGVRNKIGDLPEAAYLVILSSSLGVNAYPEQPIVSMGQPVAELRGWTLVRVTETGAVFTNGSRQVELRLDALSAIAVAGVARPGAAGDAKPFDIAQSKSRRTAVVEGSHESWVIDRAEIEWANGTLEGLLAEVQLSVYSDGGVKIDAPGSLAGERGFMQGDVVKTVNGRKINDRTDLINLANSPDFRRAGAMVVVVERAGRPYTLDYRPDFQRGPR